MLSITRRGRDLSRTARILPGQTLRKAVREAANSLLRSWIAGSIRLSGRLLEAPHQLKIRVHVWNQRRLRRRLGIEAFTPVLGFTPALEQQLLVWSAGKRNARMAFTSGTTGRPKQIPVTPRRIRKLRWTFMNMFARCARALRLRRTTLYIFSGNSDDGSLTSLLMEERGRVPYLAALQAPYRLESLPAIRELASRYGVNAVRFWLMALSDPAVLYATNPSTLSTFFDWIKSDWVRAKRLIQDFTFAPAKLPREVRIAAGRISSPGSTRRLHSIAEAPQPLPPITCFPSLRAYICWTGGYVAPFLERLDRQLDPGQVIRIPMYSMSTETLQTISHFCGRTGVQLPLAPSTLYEFIPEGQPDHPSSLLRPGQLREGQLYSMVVSNCFGLRRYQTGDLFLCTGRLRRVPILAFQRRRGLQYSFTGEKLTAEQVAEALEQLRMQFPELKDGHLSVVPSMPRGALVPHYRLVWAGEQSVAQDPACSSQLAAAARQLDTLLSELNSEYRAKRKSGRLDPPRPERTSISGLMARIQGSSVSAGRSQFKFLPLYPRLWERQ